MKNRLAILTAGITIMLVVLAACGTESKSPANNATNNNSNNTEQTIATPEASASTDTQVAKADELTKVTQVLDWFAQPAHGGFFAAKAQNFYGDANVEVELQNGGPQVSPIQIVASGKAQFGLASADSILLAREQGIPVVGLAAVLQTSPSALFYHSENTSIKSFADLNGFKVYAFLAAPYWEYVKAKFNLKDVKEFQFNGQYANFLNDTEALTQGYVTNTLADLEKQGVDVDYLLISESGYNPYYTIIFTTEQYIAENPDVVKAYVQASIKGWNYFKENPSPISEEVVKVNQNYKADAFIAEAAAQEEFVFGHDAAKHGVGYMTAERWEELNKQLQEIGVLTKNQDVSKAFTTEFLPANN